MGTLKQQNPFVAALWSFFERFSSEIITFVISIILARLLTPKDYGIVGITTIFIAFSNVFIESGFSNALIRKNDRTEEDLSTAFYFNIFVGVFLYIILYFLSPFIALYFDEPVLTQLVKVVSLIVLLNSFCIVPNAILTARLNIRLQAFIAICAQIPAGIIAIYCAYSGLGLWSLAVQQVLKCFIYTLLLWMYGRWYPKTGFSRDSFKYLWGFGSKLLTATLIGSVFNNIYSFLIGKYIGKNELGYYSKGQGLANHVSTISNGVVQKVSLPVLTKYQDNLPLLRDKFRTIMCLITMFIAPISAMCVYEADDIITFLWTEKWIETVPMFQLIVCSIVTGPIGAMSLSLFQVVNRTDITLKLEILKKSVFAIVIFITFQYGVYPLLIGMCFNNFFAALVNMYPTKFILKYSYWNQLLDILKYIFYSYLWGAILSNVIYLSSPLINIIVYSMIYIIGYVLILFVFKDGLYLKYANMVLTIISTRKEQ